MSDTQICSVFLITVFAKPRCTFVLSLCTILDFIFSANLIYARYFKKNAKISYNTCLYGGLICRCYCHDNIFTFVYTSSFLIIYKIISTSLYGTFSSNILTSSTYKSTEFRSLSSNYYWSPLRSLAVYSVRNSGRNSAILFPLNVSAHSARLQGTTN